MVKTIIILQPQKTTLDNYFHTDTTDYKFSENTTLNPSEAIALGSIAEAYHPSAIVRIPEVLYPLRVKTPDFLVDNIEYEVKAPIASSGILFLARKAETQLRSPTGFLVMELMNIRNVSLCTLLKRTYKYFMIRHIKNFIIMNHGDILYSTHV